jgi:hypothetical protein
VFILGDQILSNERMNSVRSRPFIKNLKLLKEILKNGISMVG